MASDYARNVFINCPFDGDYEPIFQAIVFTLQDLGFRPRTALERLDSGELRLAKIRELISTSQYSIHDLSRTNLDSVTALPRFNMPLELGIDLGCRWYAMDRADKRMLILDSERYRYQTYISDIAGQDIQAHENTPAGAILQVRRWLRSSTDIPLRAGSAVYNRYQRFIADIPTVCEELALDAEDLTFSDLSFVIAAWLRAND